MADLIVKSHKKQRAEKAVILVSVVAVLALFAFFLWDILIPFLKFEIAHDSEGASALLRQKGALGFLTVALVEALQMVVVFIPAEFIQISSGLSYPFPLALLFCDLGVCLGATIIFVLVRAFRFSNRAYEKSRGRIELLSSSGKDRSTVLLLLFLFFMPLIPFGAICYYGSGTKIRYWKYILTVAAGVIPSIVVSNLMGASAKAFLQNALPIWLLILIIVLLAAALFAIIFIFLNKFYFKENNGTPDSVIYTCFFRFARMLREKRQTLVADAIPETVRAPYLLLANHESFYDFYYVYRMQHPKPIAYVTNRYYLTRPVIRKIWKKAGFLSKRLFVSDSETTVGIMRMIRKGYPVVMFPEGRLSPDGRTNPIVQSGAALYRRLGVDLVLVRISGAYFSKPKWRKKFYRSNIRACVERVIRKEEIASMCDEELDALIARTLSQDASDATGNEYPQKDKAVGLENLLYRCADCGSLYTTVGRGNTLTCTACGAQHTLDDHYRFFGEPGSISEYYRKIEEMEERELDGLSLCCRVRVRAFGADGKTVLRDVGECTLTKDAFSYRSDKESFAIPTRQIPALAFSCNEEFELYHDNLLYYFYPLEVPKQAARWALAVDLLTRKRETEHSCDAQEHSERTV